MTALLARSLVGNVRDGIDAVAEAVLRRCHIARAKAPISVLLLGNGNVYAIDATTSTCSKAVSAQPTSLIATYRLRTYGKFKTTVTTADIADDLRAGAIDAGWIV